MLKRFVVIFSLLYLFSLNALMAQSIQGIWEGTTSNSFYQINIEQRGEVICGYTYDFELYNKRSRCKAKFEGYFDSKKKCWILSGTEFFENSGTHVLMRIFLWPLKDSTVHVMTGQVLMKSFMSSLASLAAEPIRFQRVSKLPNKIPEHIDPCFPNLNPEPIDTIQTVVMQRKTVIQSTAGSLDSNSIPDKELNHSFINPKLIPRQTDSVKITEKMISRKQIEQDKFSINSNEVYLKLYDNGIIDNDSVTVFYNNKMLVSHQKLSDTVIEIKLKLDAGEPTHKITLFAENLGNIAPNSAVVVITAGNKRYELRANATLEENAVIILDYVKPD